jgi:hypothetical protein
VFTASTLGLASWAVSLERTERGAGLGAGMGAFWTGLGALVCLPWGFFPSPYQLRTEVAYQERVADLDQLIRAHNEDLRLELGLSEAEAARFEDADP